MTVEEIVRELAAVKLVEPNPDGFFTAEDMAQAYGCSKHTIIKKLHKLKKAGRLECGSIRRPNLSGKIWRFDAYRILPAS